MSMEAIQVPWLHAWKDWILELSLTISRLALDRFNTKVRALPAPIAGTTATISSMSESSDGGRVPSTKSMARSTPYWKSGEH
jgi:hypothetical protein